MFFILKNVTVQGISGTGSLRIGANFLVSCYATSHNILSCKLLPCNITNYFIKAKVADIIADVHDKISYQFDWASFHNNMDL